MIYKNQGKNPPIIDNLQRLFIPDAGNTFIEYECASEPRDLNTSTKLKNKKSDPVWQIRKYKKVGDFITEYGFADGDNSYSKRVDLRESYNYDIEE